MERNIRYVVYCRKSTDEKNKQLLSIESQEAELQKLILREGLTVVGEPLVEKQTAKKPGRPEFKKMMAMIDQGEANGILAWKTDRLSRNSTDADAIITRLKDGRLQHIRTFERGYQASDNVIMLYLEFGMADQYSRDLGVNVKRGMRTRIEQGWCPGHVPAGYLNFRADEKAMSVVVKDPERFTIIKKSWKRLLEHRYSIQRVYEMAIDDGLTNTNGGKYSRSQFYHMFLNPFYYGYFRYRIDKDQKLYKGNHEPMITKDEFDQVQAMIRTDQQPRKQKNDFLYQGMFKCGRCGSLFSGYRKTRKQKNGNVHNWIYYNCAKGRNRHCKEPQVPEWLITEEVNRVLSELSIPPQFHKWALDHLRAESDQENQYTFELKRSRQRAIDICEAKIQKLLDLLLAGAIDQTRYDSKNIDLRKEKERLESLLSQTDNKVENFIGEAEKVFTFAELAHKRFVTGDMDEKRYATHMLSSNLLIKGRKPVFTLFPVFEALKKIAPNVRELSRILEPVKRIDFPMVYAKKFGKNPKWWAIQDSNL